MPFEEMSYEQLKAARDQIDGLMEQRRIAALEDFKATAQVMGMDLSALYGRMNGTAKYRDGNDTWSGKGRKPTWLLSKLNEGHAIEDFRVI